MSNDPYEMEITGKESDGSAGYTVMEPGPATATIVEIVKMHSQNDNPMVKLVMECERGSDVSLVYDNIVLIPSCEWKARQFFKALGLLKTGERFRFRWDLEGMSLPVMLDLEDYQDKEGNDRKRNTIKCYRTIKGSDSNAAARPEPTQRREPVPDADVSGPMPAPIPEDDIPF